MMNDLQQDLLHTDPSVREHALHRIMSTRDVPESICLTVAELLTDPNQFLRELAAEALLLQKRHTPLLKPRLLSAIYDRSPFVRETVTRILLGYAADEQILSAAKVLLNDSVLLVRIRAAQLVSRCSTTIELIDHSIQAGLRSEDIDCLIATCQLLAELGEKGRGYIHELTRLTRHPLGPVRANALFALGKCSLDAASLRVLAGSMVQDDDPTVRYIASKLIGSL